jgi:hypothetical protein
MFRFFQRSKKADCPVQEETRQWLERCFAWMIHSFGRENIKNRKVLTPSFKDFPVKYDGQYQSAIETLKIVATQMEINVDEIHLDIYKEGITEIDTGGVFGNRIFMKNDEQEKYSGGLYWGKHEDNKYHIGLEEKKLKEPPAIVATLSHELAHIKLLGENRIEKNNEPLTDLTTIIFGLGIFNANAAFQTKSSYDSWGWSKSGYLSQMEWGYALALFAYIREEENPDWINFLTTNVKADFNQGSRFINANKDKIFMPNNP